MSNQTEVVTKQSQVVQSVESVLGNKCAAEARSYINVRDREQRKRSDLADTLYAAGFRPEHTFSPHRDHRDDVVTVYPDGPDKPGVQHTRGEIYQAFRLLMIESLSARERECYLAPKKQVSTMTPAQVEARKAAGTKIGSKLRDFRDMLKSRHGEESRKSGRDNPTRPDIDIMCDYLCKFYRKVQNAESPSFDVNKVVKLSRELAHALGRSPDKLFGTE